MEPEILSSSDAERSGKAIRVGESKEPVPTTVESHVSSSASSHASRTSSGSAPLAASNGHAAPNGHGAGMANGAAFASAPLGGWVSGNGAPGARTSASASALTQLEMRIAESLYLRAGKRILDVAGALLALIITSPVLLLAALAIRLESRGPILYRSTRVGRNGRPFTFLKLRSMVHGADRHRHHLKHLNEADGPVFKITNDPRVTRVGRLLRVSSIDEIPQFLNVLRGEMSLVGPRPPIPEEVAQYEPWQLRRLDVRPGITCLWQISGRSRIGFQEWMRLDLEYIRNQSFALDMKILLRTIPAVLSREGAY
jgi:exopolysaccharide biosynthesis polyprenyl glycosylphosphotransferase